MARMGAMKTNAQAWGDAIERREHRATAQRSWQRAARELSAKRDSGLAVAAYLSVRKDGRLVQLHLPGVQPAELPTRGDVEGFSEDSRRRLMEFLHSLKRYVKPPAFITLTFPEELHVTAAEAKACKLAWSKRMRRKFGKRWCHIWRMEAHPEMSKRLQRVCPHIHLLTWGAWYDLAELSESWTSVVWEVLKVDECLADEAGRLVREKHEAAGTNCERLRGWGGVLYHAKNYIAKEEEFPLGKAGRVWGYWNRKALPVAEETRIPLTHGNAVAVRLEVEAWMKERRIQSDYLVCTFFDDAPEAFVARLMKNCDLLANPRMPMPNRPKKAA